MESRKRTTTALCLFLGLCIGLTGCTMAPTYIRPETPVPDVWPSGPAYQQQPGNASGQGVTDIPWQSFFTDSHLQGLIKLALENNRNLRIAALNIERSRAQYQIKRAELIPKLDALSIVNNQAASDQKYTVALGVSGYELDLFGRVQSLKDQALEQYLATEQARHTVQISLVAEVAVTALNLAADRERLQLSQETLKTQQSSLALIQRRFEVGASSELDLRQAQTQVESARVDIARAITLVAQDENNLNLVMGCQAPANLLPSRFSEKLEVQEVRPGLPSTVLLRRPDILQAEHQLKGFNANIGAARAAFFPRITLISTVGTRSDELSGLFKSGSDVWTFSPQIVVPIFDAGARSAQLQVAEVDREIAVAQYEQAIQTGFREVADALAQRGTIDEQWAAQQALVTATNVRYLLAQARYDKGIDSYLNVLDAQRSLYSAQQGLIATRLARLINLVTLYKVLGDGSKEGLHSQ
ncbi:efflux transporter outer membrane subunit [uncultured Desulfobulbus sp.]|uniref:efflux transporter outer membrane subunit n=1 Tax=uncultured Desulfobulbus sp. TaxID=239745 RepID=UPI0029C74CBE|nr:efflux transporter outer membrane subunit [uncultured Desulfobulbus sp.]